ncbi:hypothetical protein H0H92_010099, partial [Tricholoma furcatifolium]
MNADMEAAQILATGIAFLPMNKPEYSKINTTTPEESLVAPQDFQRLISFLYLKSQEELDKFSHFVKDLKIKKRKVGRDQEIKSAYATEILGNKETKLFHRTSCKAQRKSASTRKAHDAVE